MNLPSILTGFADKEPKQANRIERSGPCAMATIPGILLPPPPHNCSAAVARQRRQSPGRTATGCNPLASQSNLYGMASQSNLNGLSGAIFEKIRTPLRKGFIAIALLLTAGLTPGLSFAQSSLRANLAFGTNPIEPGAMQTVEITITNLIPIFADSIRLQYNINEFLSESQATVELDSDTCGGTLSSNSWSLTGGFLAAGGSSGDSCTVNLSFTVPDDLPAGNYPTMTTLLRAHPGGINVTGGNTHGTASATMTVVAPPPPADADLAVTVTDGTDPIAPGASELHHRQWGEHRPGRYPGL